MPYFFFTCVTLSSWYVYQKATKQNASPQFFSREIKFTTHIFYCWLILCIKNNIWYFFSVTLDSLKELLLKILEVHIYSAKSLKTRSLPPVRPHLRFLDPPLIHVHYKSLTYTLGLQYRQNSKHIISLIIECALHSHLIRFNWTILSCRSQPPNKKNTLSPTL